MEAKEVYNILAIGHLSSLKLIAARRERIQ
jgi:hypothetical protein